jgi:serine/threonine protein kinase
MKEKYKLSHGGLKPGNIFIDTKKNNIILGDFGLN